MELIFIRHAHGEHLKDYPNQLNMLHPNLTDYGVYQVIELRKKLEILDDDLIVVSPSERAIQTAEILTQGNDFYVSPCVGPRIFPQNPNIEELLCDRIYNKTEIQNVFKGIKILDFGLNIWDTGINRIDQELFDVIAEKLIHWCCQHVKVKRTIIISHDGTITNYRIFLGETSLTREDFLGETGIYRIRYVCGSEKA